MRNEIEVEKLGKPVFNRVLVEVIDTFQEFLSKGGITLVNATAEEAWADSEIANITEFIVRHGKVVDLPQNITSGSFDYDTEMEIEKGDIVYWNSISFKEHIPIVCDGKKYLLVDYHELLIRIRGKEIMPINGFALLKPIEESTSFGVYTTTKKLTDRWEIVYKPEQLNIELAEQNKFEDLWEVGDVVYTLVREMPYRVEGFINKILKEQLYAVPMRMILYSDTSI